jgi:hypothetical protein
MKLAIEIRENRGIILIIGQILRHATKSIAGYRDLHVR